MEEESINTLMEQCKEQNEANERTNQTMRKMRLIKERRIMNELITQKRNNCSRTKTRNIYQNVNFSVQVEQSFQHALKNGETS